MSETLPNTIIYHFDVKSHSLPIEQFIDTAKATLEIIDNFNQEFFDNSLKYELHVLATEPGGLIDSFSINVLAGLAVSGGLLIGNAVIEVETSHGAPYWAKEIIKAAKHQLQADPSKSTIIIDLPPKLDGAKPRAVLPTAMDREIAESVLSQLTTELVKTTPEDLENTGFKKDKFKKAYAAKNAVYRACLENPNVKALGFDRSHNFSVKRANFSSHIADLPEEKIEWKHDILHMLVTSPNARKEGRKWQGIVKHQGRSRVVEFQMEDAAIWKLIESHNLISHVGEDHMRIQWAYRDTDTKKIKDARVLRVLEFNGTPLSSRLSGEEIERLLKNVIPSEADENQIDMFEHSDLKYVSEINDERSGLLSTTEEDGDNQQQQQKVKLTDGS